MKYQWQRAVRFETRPYTAADVAEFPALAGLTHEVPVEWADIPGATEPTMSSAGLGYDCVRCTVTSAVVRP